MKNNVPATCHEYCKICKIIINMKPKMYQIKFPRSIHFAIKKCTLFLILILIRILNEDREKAF